LYFYGNHNVYKYMRKSCLSCHWHCHYIVYRNFRVIFSSK